MQDAFATQRSSSLGRREVPGSGSFLERLKEFGHKEWCWRILLCNHFCCHCFHCVYVIDWSVCCVAMALFSAWILRPSHFSSLSEPLPGTWIPPGAICQCLLCFVRFQLRMGIFGGNKAELKAFIHKWSFPGWKPRGEGASCFFTSIQNHGLFGDGQINPGRCLTHVTTWPSGCVKFPFELSAAHRD